MSHYDSLFQTDKSKEYLPITHLASTKLELNETGKENI